MGVKLLGKMKIHEIAKELGLTSKDVIAKANELGMIGIQYTNYENLIKELGGKLKWIFKI